MEELFGKTSGSKPSGGMKATVDERGKLIWE
jgi:glutamine synthetase type III